MDLNKKTLKSYYTVYAIIASIAYLVPTIYFLLGEGNRNIWLTYLGNFLFFISIVISIAFFNSQANRHASLKSLFFTGLRTTIIAVIFSAIVIFVLAAIKYGYFETKTSDIELATQSATDNSLMYRHEQAGVMMIINAVIVNFFMGTLGSLIGSSVTKRNQTTEKGRE